MEIIKWDGKPISVPGVYANVPMSAYHGKLTEGDSCSRSGVWKVIEKSTAHLYVGHYSNPDREESEESEALIVGRAAHHLLLGEDDFASYFTVRPDTYPDKAVFPDEEGDLKPWNANSKWCKSWLADAAAASLTVLKPSHVEMIEGMASSLHANPIVRAGILNGLIETTLVSRHPQTGIWMKIRPDAMPNDGEVADLKTIADITDAGIEKAIADSGLFLQGAMVRRVMQDLGLPFHNFTLVFVEKAPPYCVRIKTLIEGDLDLGDAALEAGIRLYKRALDRSAWFGPGGEQTDFEYAQMNPWQRGRIEHRIQQIEKELSL